MRLEPLKVVYQLIVVEKDDEGNIVGEHPQQPVTLYRPQFGQLEERVNATMATAEDIEAESSASREKRQP